MTSSNFLRTACVSLAVLGSVTTRSFAQQAPAAEPAASRPPAASLEEALGRARTAIEKAEELGDDAQGQLDEAKLCLQEVARFDQTNATANFLYARMNILIGFRREAFNDIEKYILTAEGRNDWKAHKILGDLHLQGSYYVMAEDKYKTALRLSPNEPSIYIGLARVASKRTLKTEALEYAAKAVELDPEDAQAHEIHATALAVLSRFDDAKMAIQKAITQTRTELEQNPASRTMLSALQGRLQTLEQVLQAIIQRDPKTATAYVELHECIQLQSDARTLAERQSSLEVLKRGVEATRPDTPSDLVLEYAQETSRFGRTNDAITIVEEHLKSHPSDEKANELLAVLRTQLNSETSALTTDIR